MMTRLMRLLFSAREGCLALLLWAAALVCAVASPSLPLFVGLCWAGLGWARLGWAYKVPDAACQKIPCPSAAAQRAVGPQPKKNGFSPSVWAEATPLYAWASQLCSA